MGRWAACGVGGVKVNTHKLRNGLQIKGNTL